MARLNYSLTIHNESTLVAGYIQLLVTGNRVGEAYGRIYLDGSAAPAFTAMVVAGDNRRIQVNDLPAGTYVIEYKDDNGEKTIGKATIVEMSTSCYPSDGNDGGTTVKLVVSDTGITSYVTTLGSLTSDKTPAISIDEGVTYKTPTLDSFNNFVASWSNAELATLGVLSHLPVVVIKRVSSSCVTNQAELIMIDGGVTYDEMSASYSKTDCSAAGANDGTITLSISGGSGSRTYSWSDGPTTQNRLGLAPGLYSVTITDVTTLEEVVISNIQIQEPQPPPTVIVEGSLLEFPVLNDLQWVVDPVDPETDQDSVTLDNVLFENQNFGKYQKACYFQKVLLSDIRLVQFNSDFGSHLVELYDYLTDELVKSYTAVMKQENIGIVEDYNIQIRNHVDNPGKSRVYFTGNIGGLPITLEAGNTFEIINNLEGFNGNYSVVSIENDIFLNTNYIVITLNYTGVGTTSAATGRFLNTIEDYNVFESQISFGGVNAGKYYLKVTALNDDTVGKIAVSEPIHLKNKWPNTNLIQYINIDNGYGNITWTTGYIGKIRVESIIGPKRLTAGGERGISRNSNYDPVKTYAKKVRGILFETFVLPPYLHEKLGLIFDCDSFSINGVDYQATEGYADPNYIDEFKFANSSIKLEQLGWNKKYNSNDISTVIEGGFLMTETGFLKR